MRNFPDFLAAYADYAKDSWCPDRFHFWSGVSIVAAALERKVWMLQKRSPKTRHYPNLYILLVAAPGDGKTTAASRAIDILKEVQSPAGKVSFVPTQITHAALVKAMHEGIKTFSVGAQQYSQSAAYFYAGECSNALKEIKGGGDIFPFFTEAYDCGKEIKKATIIRKDETIKYPCMNILGCSTFDNLKGMLTDGGILGGFISRFMFVVNQEKLIRTPSIDDEEVVIAEDPRVFKLVQDLQQIYTMTGQFAPDRDYRNYFKKFFPENDAERYSKDSEREQAILARKGASVIKLSMILSASESSEKVLTGKHWNKAIELLKSLEDGYDKVIEVSHRANSQNGIDAMIFGFIRLRKGLAPRNELINYLAMKEVDRIKAGQIIDSMIGTNALQISNVGGKPHLSVPVNL